MASDSIYDTHAIFGFDAVFGEVASDYPVLKKNRQHSSQNSNTSF
jgi:hypothetical protein